MNKKDQKNQFINLFLLHKYLNKNHSVVFTIENRKMNGSK